jgi:Matrixin
MFRSLVVAAVTTSLFVPVAHTGTVESSAAADQAVTVIGEAIMAPGVVEALVAGSAVPSAVPVSCSDAAYALASWRLGATYKWSYNPVGAPGSVAGTALSALQTASQTIATGQNRCGRSASLSTSQQYLGSTTKAAQISATAACTGNDGASVTSWGKLPAGYLAYTCVYFNSSKVVLSSDMLIDNAAHRWFTTRPAGCVNAYDLVSVAVHERGHTAGLAHVEQAAHAAQAMSPKTLPCDVSERTLNTGDLNGLQAKYGL